MSYPSFTPADGSSPSSTASSFPSFTSFASVAAPTASPSVPTPSPTLTSHADSSSSSSISDWGIIGIVFLCLLAPFIIAMIIRSKLAKQLWCRMRGLPDPFAEKPPYPGTVITRENLPQWLAENDRINRAKAEAKRLREEQERAARPDTPSSEFEMKTVNFQDKPAPGHAPPGQNYPAMKPLPPMRNLTPSPFVSRTNSPSPYAQPRTSSPSPYVPSRTNSPLPARMTRWPGPPRVDSPVSSLDPSETPYDDDLQPNGQPWPAHSTDPKRFEGNPEKAARLNFF